jgi:hypothetical protein
MLSVCIRRQDCYMCVASPLAAYRWSAVRVAEGGGVAILTEAASTRAFVHYFQANTGIVTLK